MTPEQSILYLAGLLVGMAIGSFIGCAIYRIPRGLSLWKTRSACPSCKATLAPFEMIPVFSYAFQRGHCRRCNTRMAPSYFWAELACGFVGLLIVFVLIQMKVV